MSDQQVALVTGASRGLGAAIATALGRDGFAVAVNYARNRDAAEAVRSEIVAAGGRAEIFGADVTIENEVAGLYEAVTAGLGGIDVLVLNATGPQPSIAVDALTWRDVLDQLEFFVKSPLLLTQHVIPGMRERGWGRIIHIGSEVFELGTPGSSAYVAGPGARPGRHHRQSRRAGIHPHRTARRGLRRHACGLHGGRAARPHGSGGRRGRGGRVPRLGAGRLCHRPADRGERRQDTRLTFGAGLGRAAAVSWCRRRAQCRGTDSCWPTCRSPVLDSALSSAIS
jgi:short chain dehydrogenase